MATATKRRLFVLTLDNIIVGVYDRFEAAQTVAADFGVSGAWVRRTDAADGMIWHSAPCGRSITITPGQQDLCETWQMIETTLNASAPLCLSSTPMAEIYDLVSLHQSSISPPHYNVRLFSEVIAGRDKGRQQESTISVAADSVYAFQQALIRDGFPQNGASAQRRYQRRRIIPEDDLDGLFRLREETYTQRG